MDHEEEEVKEDAHLDLDDAFLDDEADLNDEGMESLESLEDYEDDDTSSEVDSFDQNY